MEAKAKRRGRPVKMDRSKLLEQARALWLRKPTWTAHGIAARVAGDDASSRAYLRKQLSADDAQACLEESRQLRLEHADWTVEKIIQHVKAAHGPRRKKLRKLFVRLAVELARMVPPEPRRRAEVVQPAARPSGSFRLDWRSLGPMVAEGERAAVVVAQVEEGLAKARPWMPSKEQLAVLRSHLEMMNWLEEHRGVIESAVEVYHEVSQVILNP
ncbi:MAG TPA: hypothetical protein VKU44_01180 [Terriglobia bacterium]|nr:hypothetical protein [Terriglobia bacterium]